MRQLINLGVSVVVDWAPVTEIEEIVQNVRTILSTLQGTVPLDRDFGISGYIVDDPTPLAQARLTAEIVRVLQRYEPRVKVIKVSYSGDMTGRLSPQMEVDIHVKQLA